jgi:hypothetical protein
MTLQHYLDGVAAYRALFWPSFVEHDGCVFLSFDEQIYRDWFVRCDGDRQAIEATMNHRHILDVLPPVVEEPTRELVLVFGRLLRDALEAKINARLSTSHFRRDLPRRFLGRSYRL